MACPLAPVRSPIDGARRKAAERHPGREPAAALHVELVPGALVAPQSSFWMSLAWPAWNLLVCSRPQAAAEQPAHRLSTHSRRYGPRAPWLEHVGTRFISRPPGCNAHRCQECASFGHNDLAAKHVIASRRNHRAMTYKDLFDTRHNRRIHI